jgi:hypothetical protein
VTLRVLENFLIFGGKDFLLSFQQLQVRILGSLDAHHDAPPPRNQVYLAACNASDPYQQWEGSALSGAVAPSTIASSPSARGGAGEPNRRP